MESLSQVITIARMSSGQRISAYNQVRVLAVEDNFTELRDVVDEALAHDRKTRDLDDHWEADESQGQYPPAMHSLDNLADNTITSIRDIAAGRPGGLPAHDPLHKEVDQFLTEVYPAGVFAITSLPYVDQAAAVENILDKLQGPLAPMVKKLTLEDKVKQLATLAVEYRRFVDERFKPLDFAAVSEARDRGHEYLLEVVAVITGKYHSRKNPTHVAKRARLLGPILTQDRLARAENRRSRARSNDTPDAPDGEAPETPATAAPAAQPEGQAPNAL